MDPYCEVSSQSFDMNTYNKINERLNYIQQRQIYYKKVYKILSTICMLITTICSIVQIVNLFYKFMPDIVYEKLDTTAYSIKISEIGIFIFVTIVQIIGWRCMSKSMEIFNTTDIYKNIIFYHQQCGTYVLPSGIEQISIINDNMINILRSLN